MKWYPKVDKVGFELVMVSFDDNEKAMLKYMKKKKVNFPALKFSETKLSKKYESEYIPHMVLIDESGKVVSTKLDEIKKLIK